MAPAVNSLSHILSESGAMETTTFLAVGCPALDVYSNFVSGTNPRQIFSVGIFSGLLVIRYSLEILSADKCSAHRRSSVRNHK